MADLTGADGGLRELALFAGAGGGLLAGLVLGWKTVCAVERDEFAASVLVQRQNDRVLPAFPVWDNVCTFDGSAWRGIIDVVSGGFPCQAYSSAAAGANVADDLWSEMRRIVADVAPRYVFAENVARAAVDAAADDLEQMGYQTRCVELSAKDLGADHVRRRCWLIAYTDDPGELLRAVNAKVEVVPSMAANVWMRDPGVARVSDGLANRMDRLKATGNGQVPIVAIGALAALAGP